jgi:hypothetical protein
MEARMLEEAHAVVVLLTGRYSNRLLVMGLAGGDAEDAVVSPQGAMLVKPGVGVTGLHCIETGEDLKLDEDYAVFHTGNPSDFVERFVPALRTAITELGWPSVRSALTDYLASQE